MEKTEIVDEMGHGFFAEQGYMVHTDELEGNLSNAHPIGDITLFLLDDHDPLTAENTDDSNHDPGDKIVPLREQDRFLPIANVAKIMKKAIPETGKVNNKVGMSLELNSLCFRKSYLQIAKDARECVQECVSEFISFITSEASDRCHMEKRKTINGEDILFAMSSLGFDNYVEPLKIYLQKYREVGFVLVTFVVFRTFF